MSRTLILGTVSGVRLTALSPVGEINDRVIFPLCGAEEDKSSDDDKAGKEGEESDDEEDDDEDGDGSEEDKKPNRRKQAATENSTIRDMRRRMRAMEREKAARDKADREKELASKGDAERFAAERDDAVKERDTYKGRWEAAQIELDIVKASNRAKYAWNDIEDVLNDKKVRDAIEIGDDGEISGVEEALKDLAKRKPHFLAKSEEDNSGKGTGTRTNNGNNVRSSGSSGKTGSQPNGGGSGDRAADRQRLTQNYPFLAQLPGD